MQIGGGLGLRARGLGALAPQSPLVTLSGNTQWRWLEADLGETLEQDDLGGGGNYVVTQANDQSGNGFNVGASSTARPRKELHGFNGQPCWVGDGSNDRLVALVSSIASLITGNDKSWWCYVVCQALRLPSSSGVIWSVCNSASNSNFVEFMASSTGSTWRVRKNAGSNVDAVGGAVDLNRHVFKLICNGTDVRIYKDRVLDTVTPAPNLDTATHTLNSDAIFCFGGLTLSAFFYGRVRAQLFGAGTLTAQQIQELDDYCSWFTVPQEVPLFALTADSHGHTDTGETTYMSMLQAAYPTDTIINNGEPGARLSTLMATPDLIYRYAHSNFDAGRRVCAYGNFLCSNDLEDGRSADAIADDLEEWNGIIEAAHPGVPRIGFTPWKNAALTAGEETQRQLLRTELLTNWAARGFTIAPLDGGGLITEDGGDPSVFIDGKHINDTGEGHVYNGRGGVEGMGAKWAAMRAA